MPATVSNPSNESNPVLTPAESGERSNSRSTFGEEAISVLPASDADPDALSDWLDFGRGSVGHSDTPSSGAGVVSGDQPESLEAHISPPNTALPIRNSPARSQRGNDGDLLGQIDPEAETWNAPIGPVEDWPLDDEMFAGVDFNFEEMPCSFTIDSAMDFSDLLPTIPAAVAPAPVAPNVGVGASADSATLPQPALQRFASIKPTRPPGERGIQKSSATKKRGVRGPFKTTEERFETSLTRQLGACIRCTKQKARVRTISHILPRYTAFVDYQS